MDPALLLQGIVLGFTIAAAVGPISLLCIRRTLAEGRTVGLVRDEKAGARTGPPPFDYWTRMLARTVPR